MIMEERFKADTAYVEQALSRYFSDPVPYGELYEAMKYSLMAGGKRIRPVLVLECCRACGGDPERVLPLACALEMIHTYSLIHDDLPCMDNDDLRRGRPTCHKVFGEDMATLAGDGLLTAAFGVATGEAVRAKLTPEQIVSAVHLLSRAAGEDGMVAGQVLDITWESRTDLTRQELEEIHTRKTGALLRCACGLGGIGASASPEERAALETYATALGMAFQIRDDILDVLADEQLLGKPVGSDAENGKTTFVTLLGPGESQKLVESLTAQAKEAAGRLKDPEFLIWMADRLADRAY